MEGMVENLETLIDLPFGSLTGKHLSLGYFIHYQ